MDGSIGVTDARTYLGNKTLRQCVSNWVHPKFSFDESSLKTNIKLTGLDCHLQVWIVFFTVVANHLCPKSQLTCSILTT